ncbi:helix-turn-helix transcriptional regulator [Bradyrhizobium sp. U87765 SZCCT0131]|uniref:helix-turn-helix transcriptional regulator n=1 Tax=unclassified Bradyrhizobium TaxID=2631580 RepID=UPI001BAA1C3E|nr:MULTISPECIES: helix-turn-helix transcriptional regulator [unclassified Bradyrhizobium]MBR1219512.1 helix-turn-helix transcriptional regulator [Bradyrhizobium sp. U87765 SZCCT0131]MBR1262163.1 helix-turn-helix transcriptional regulator [Bradyrhizobium sp. U87765 SZCCT0134]MBR1308654.1 helix-turn-helix transcriptional regulator [Bradyrhizobium sp. U87765 SZCCT0110]MBR1317945.1 helix-turn-helix transcriptional regulator [Bradyrhizobium sp. U87765 SZCCT0109]MBR1351648.1 helix-turn-helix transcr
MAGRPAIDGISRGARAADDITRTDITSAVLAIGRPAFPQALIGALRRVAGVGHCMVFSFAGERSARCLLDIGNIPTGGDLGVAYSQHFHQADPNRDAIFGGQAAPTPIVLPTFARRMYDDSYRKLFFEDSDIVDKFATAIWVGDTCFYVNFYRITAQGRFSRAQTERLRRVAPAVSAAVARHFDAAEMPAAIDASPAPDARGSLAALFAHDATFEALTGREKEVCLRILSGYSSEAISADLDISIHSTLTYRKRAYDKLRISSQNELFGIVLQLLTAERRLN